MIEELSRLTPQKFQELCSVLLQRQFTNLRAVDGSGGDEGVDAWIPETQTYFQFHAPQLRVKREKVRRYLNQAAAHTPLKWIFVTNRDFTRSQWKWFDDLRLSVSFEMEVWGATALISQLRRHPDLVEHYLNPASDQPTILIGSQHAKQINNISADAVNLRMSRGQRRPRIFVSGIVANDPEKLGYLRYLIRRYNDFKEWEVGKAQMRYPLIYKAYQRELKYTLSATPLDEFSRSCQYLQRRIENTKLARIKAGTNDKLYESFEEFSAHGSGSAILS